MSSEGDGSNARDRLIPPASARRRAIQRLLGLGRAPILVASMSRAGSTLLFKATGKGWAAERFGRRAGATRPLIMDFAWRLDETPLVGGVVYKTHDLPAYLPKGSRPKVLFTFRRASDVAISIALRRQVDGPRWFKQHQRNLRADAGYKAFLRGDSLGLETQIEAWSSARGLDVFGIRYESLWSRRSQIEDFLGFRVPLPPKRPVDAASQLAPELVERLRRTYQPLDQRIDAMPDVFLRTAASPRKTPSAAPLTLQPVQRG